MAAKKEIVPGRKYDARVIKVKDGDTVELDVILEKEDKDLGFGFRRKTEIIYNESFRLDGIDTKEIHDKDDIKKNMGLMAKKFLDSEISKVNGDVSIITVKNKDREKKEKYGRFLATLFIGNKNINQEMIRLGFSKEYHGEKR